MTVENIRRQKIMFSCKLTKLEVREVLLTQQFYRKVYKNTKEKQKWLWDSQKLQVQKPKKLEKMTMASSDTRQVLTRTKITMASTDKDQYCSFGQEKVLCRKEFSEKALLCLVTNLQPGISMFYSFLLLAHLSKLLITQHFAWHFLS